MKLTKDALKSLIKECILEVLTDGLGETITESRNITSRQRRSVNEGLVAPRRQPLIQQHVPSQSMKNEAMKRAVAEVAGNDSIMKSILADTAATTLPEMMNNDLPNMAPRAHGVEERIVEAHDPDQIFGEDVTSKWVALAFSPSSKPSLIKP